MEKDVIVELSEIFPRVDTFQFKQKINWKIKNNEHWAVIGANGSGKTLLIDILLGKYAIKSGEIKCQDKDGVSQPVSSVVKSVAFRDIYSIVDSQNSYYQQRWNKGIEQEVPLVKDIVSTTDHIWLEKLTEWFGIADLMNKEVTLLSSGELRKFLIVRSLLSKPRILILDNPFIGLDAKSRVVLNDLFLRMAEMENLQIVLILSNPQDIPDFITHVLPVKEKEILPFLSSNEFKDNKELINFLFYNKPSIDISKLRKIDKNPSTEYQNTAILEDIHIEYDKRVILKNLSWQIKRGEKWALLGPNGSGKSTLLSLICGDNPQAYANNITLFDRKRGSGESIWDIKKHIGYISPEMHLYYLKNVKCSDVIGSGFFDTIGLYRKCNPKQEEESLKWMESFGILHLKDISFLHISSGEQRLVLLARLFVKNPDLLILDEPLHGLDFINKKRVKKLIEEFCDKNKSLIYVTHYEDEIPDIIDQRLQLIKNEY